MVLERITIRPSASEHLDTVSSMLVRKSEFTTGTMEVVRAEL
jgi:hypothetical protein